MTAQAFLRPAGRPPGMAEIEFFVEGIPVPQGSKTVFGGRAVDANAKKLKPWRKAVTAAAADAGGGLLLEGPVTLAAVFVLPRPKSHFRTGRNAHLLRDDAPRWVSTKPDLDKLVRALADGITDSGLWKDDNQVASILATKVYAHPSDSSVFRAVVGVAVKVRSL